MKLALVDDWKSCLRWWSARLSLLNAAGLQAWLMLPPDLKAALPPTVMAWLASSLAVLTFIALLIDQPATRTGAEP